ncbi:MAG TPA: hypothetical protein VFT06_04695, partial [Flavisolibacter sp.]|nr:hypothetical protein [Flavisolibacter sp.]
MKKNTLLFLGSLLVVVATHAQHEHGQRHDPVPPVKDTVIISKPAAKDTVPHAHTHPMEAGAMPTQGTTEGGHDHEAMMQHDHQAMTMSHAFSRNLPMTRNGSGTAWLPDNSPMYGYMFHSGKWMYMLHGDVFLRYNKQDLLNKGQRGDSKFDAPNMVMLMGQRTVGKKGLFHFNTMFSLDPLTVGNGGYPLL